MSDFLLGQGHSAARMTRGAGAYVRRIEIAKMREQGEPPISRRLLGDGWTETGRQDDGQIVLRKPL
jgi:hypothetical protein